MKKIFFVFIISFFAESLIAMEFGFFGGVNAAKKIGDNLQIQPENKKNFKPQKLDFFQDGSVFVKENRGSYGEDSSASLNSIYEDPEEHIIFALSRSDFSKKINQKNYETQREYNFAVIGLVAERLQIKSDFSKCINDSGEDEALQIFEKNLKKNYENEYENEFAILEKIFKQNSQNELHIVEEKFKKEIKLKEQAKEQAYEETIQGYKKTISEKEETIQDLNYKQSQSKEKFQNDLVNEHRNSFVQGAMSVVFSCAFYYAYYHLWSGAWSWCKGLKELVIPKS